MSQGLPARTIVSGTLHAWRRNLVYVTLLAGVVQLPLLALQLAIFGDEGVRVTTNDEADVWVVAFVVALSVTIAHHFLAGVLEELEGAEREGHPPPTVRALIHKLPWVRLVVADVVISVASVVGLVFLILPGLVIASVFSLTMPLLNMEGYPVWSTMKRSYRLARPHLWTVTWVWVAAQTLVSIGTEALAVLILLLGHNFAVDLAGHLVPEMVLLPLGALPAVIMTYLLTDAEREREQASSPAA